MKKFVLAGLLLASFCASFICADSLISAVRSSDNEQVKMLLGIYESLDSSYKSLLLSEAKQASCSAEKNLTFFQSPKDMALVAAGLFIMTGAIAPTFPRVQQIFNMTWGSDADKGGVILWGAVSAFFMYKGITLMYAREKLKAAQEIYELIDQKPVRHIK